MKMMLSMPRTISSASNVRKATQACGSAIQSIKLQSPFSQSYQSETTAFRKRRDFTETRRKENEWNAK